jgi:hypothetical protein
VREDFSLPETLDACFDGIDSVFLCGPILEALRISPALVDSADVLLYAGSVCINEPERMTAEIEVELFTGPSGGRALRSRFPARIGGYTASCSFTIFDCPFAKFFFAVCGGIALAANFLFDL